MDKIVAQFQDEVGERVLKCEAECIVDDKPPMLQSYPLDEGVMEEKWETPSRYWVKGSMAEWVKPVEEVM